MEISEIYQFDRLNFFSVQKIILQNDVARKLKEPNQIEQLIIDQFKPQFFQRLEQVGMKLYV